jgi:hypothetical protein
MDRVAALSQESQDAGSNHLANFGAQVLRGLDIGGRLSIRDLGLFIQDGPSAWTEARSKVADLKAATQLGTARSFGAVFKALDISTSNDADDILQAVALLQALFEDVLSPQDPSGPVNRRASALDFAQSLLSFLDSKRNTPASTNNNSAVLWLSSSIALSTVLLRISATKNGLLESTDSDDEGKKSPKNILIPTRVWKIIDLCIIASLEPAMSAFSIQKERPIALPRFLLGFLSFRPANRGGSILVSSVRDRLPEDSQNIWDCLIPLLRETLTANEAVAAMADVLLCVQPVELLDPLLKALDDEKVDRGHVLETIEIAMHDHAGHTTALINACRMRHIKAISWLMNAFGPEKLRVGEPKGNWTVLQAASEGNCVQELVDVIWQTCCFASSPSNCLIRF